MISNLYFLYNQMKNGEEKKNVKIVELIKGKKNEFQS